MAVTWRDNPRGDLECLADGRRLFRYVYRPDVPRDESPKPYIHPLCTLAGEELTLWRPHDHAWHHGLAMTSAWLSGDNFWGGPTYVRDAGYRQLDNHGVQQHEGFEAPGSGATAVVQQLAWISAAGERWLDERRTLDVRGDEVQPAEGWWVLRLRFALTNVRGRELVFGSPTTQGRELAGYGGLFWRGPRSMAHGTVLAAGGQGGAEMMGRRAAWLAYRGRHDGSLRWSTLVFADDPGNPRYPNQWFVRCADNACASCAFMFDEPLVLPAGETLTLNYRLLVMDGAPEAEQIERVLGRVPPAAG